MARVDWRKEKRHKDLWAKGWKSIHWKTNSDLQINLIDISELYPIYVDKQYMVVVKSGLDTLEKKYFKKLSSANNYITLYMRKN